MRILLFFAASFAGSLYAQTPQDRMAREATANYASPPRAPLLNPSCPTAKNVEALEECLKKRNAFQSQKVAFVPIKDPNKQMPISTAKGDIDKLEKAVRDQVKACTRTPGKDGNLPHDKSFTINVRDGNRSGQYLIWRQNWCVQSNTALLKLIDQAKKKHPSNKQQQYADVMRAARSEFDWYKADCEDNGDGETMFTGYYTPKIKGKMNINKTTGEPIPGKVCQHPYSVPVFGLPADFEEKSFPDGKGGTVKKSCFKNGDCPYRTRQEIEAQYHPARGADNIIACVERPLSKILGQVQGSIVITEDGQDYSLNYAGKNGYSTVLARRVMSCQCVDATKYPFSMQGVRSYFADHPQNVSWLEDLDKGYVFFKYENKKAQGSSGAVVTEGVSAAIPSDLYPYGLLTIADQGWSDRDKNDNIVKMEYDSSFMLTQDRGGAIQGCRVDRFMGEGDEVDSPPAHLASKMRDRGAFYFALPRGALTSGDL